MKLTEHFSDTELGVAGCSDQIIANATELCVKILEPIRAQFGPVAVHDGYRDAAHNARVGGKPDSQHLYLDQNSAADISCPSSGLSEVFDWIRLESELPFDEVILEYSGGVPACVHVSYNGSLTNERREALTGQTGAGKVYTPVKVC